MVTLFAGLGSTFDRQPAWAREGVPVLERSTAWREGGCLFWANSSKAGLDHQRLTGDGRAQQPEHGYRSQPVLRAHPLLEIWFRHFMLLHHIHSYSISVKKKKKNIVEALLMDKPWSNLTENKKKSPNKKNFQKKMSDFGNLIFL